MAPKVAFKRLAFPCGAAACATLLVLLSALTALIVRPPEAAPPWQRYDPDDDVAWGAISPAEVSWAAIEPLHGEPAERVIDVLGPPVHSRRRVEAGTGCAAVYLYPVALAGQHSTVGLCINYQGRLDGSIGQHKFNVRSYEHESGVFSASIVVAVLIGALLAVVALRVRRRASQSLAPRFRAP